MTSLTSLNVLSILPKYHNIFKQINFKDIINYNFQQKSKRDKFFKYFIYKYIISLVICFILVVITKVYFIANCSLLKPNDRFDGTMGIYGRK